MKNTMRITIAALLVCLAVTGHAQSITPITQINNVEDVANDFYNKPISWFQGDSIRFDVYARHQLAPLDFTGMTFPVLFVASDTNSSLVYLAVTGTVQSATNGHVRVFVPHTSALLPTNTYKAWMTVYRITDSLTQEVATVAYSHTTVIASPFGTQFDTVEPITPPWEFTIEAGAFSAEDWATFPATANVNAGGNNVTNIGSIGNGTNTINFTNRTIGGGAWTFSQSPAIPGYATGTPLYVESDPVWVEASTGYATKVQIANMATGTPVYAETDPLWTAQKSGYATGTPIYSVAGLATGSPLYAFTESDPVWSAASNLYATTAGVAATYATITAIEGKASTAAVAVVAADVATRMTTSAAYAAFAPINPLYAVNGQNITGRWFAAGNTTGGTLAFVGGGTNNNASGQYATVAGGQLNTAEELAAVGGGFGNSAMGARATVSGGLANSVTGIEASIGGGRQNFAVGDVSTIGGGEQNSTTGGWGTIPGGINNTATTNAFAAGIGAKATNSGSFVWSGPGDTNATFGSFGDNTFNVRAVGGMYFLSPSLYMKNTNGVTWASLTPTGGMHVGTNSFTIDGAGNVVQSIDNTTSLGTTTVAAITLAGVTLTDWTRFATGSPVYSLAGYATGTPIYSVAGLATGTPIYSVAGLATGTPIYSVAGLATGVPIYSVAGLATGSPLYAESDPVWTAASTGYATKVQLSAYATGTPIYTVSGLATGTPIYTIAGLATGTPLYAYTETDGVWVEASTGYLTKVAAASTYATGSPIYSVSGLATGSPVYAEADPVWVAASTGYAVKAATEARIGSNETATATAQGLANTNQTAIAALLATTSATDSNLTSTGLTVASNDTRLVTLEADHADTSNRVDTLETKISDDATNQYVIIANNVTSPPNSSLIVTNDAIAFKNSSGVVAPLYNGLSQSFVTVPSGNTNYLRFTSAQPTNAAYSGSWGQYARIYDSPTSMIFAVYGAESNKWYGVRMHELPLP